MHCRPHFFPKYNVMVFLVSIVNTNGGRKKTYYGPNDDSHHLGHVVHKVAHLWPQVVLLVLCLLLWESVLMVWGRGKREERVGNVIVDGGVGRRSWCYG